MTQGQRFLEELSEGVLIGDGAIGTALFARGAPPEQGVERLNVLDPDLVLGLHREYVEAGSRVIETNTFRASLPNLARYGVESEDEVRRIILAGVQLARAASAGRAYVAGSVGPLPNVNGEPMSLEDQKAAFTFQISALLEGGVDLLILESFTAIDELAAAMGVARALSEVPIVSQAAFGAEGRIADGSDAAEVARRCIEAGADVVGANCGYGALAIVRAIKMMAPLGAPMSAYLTAGFPEKVEERLVYVATPQYLAERAIELLDLGVRLIGGCCGTEPETIHIIAEAIRGHKRTTRAYILKPAEQPPCPTREIPAPGPLEGFPILVELDPPRDLNLEPILAAARMLKQAGATGITVADNPLASVRVDNLAVAERVQQECGTPVIPHITGRDRNRLAIQSRIMGAHIMGIRALVCVTGDPVRMCQEPNTSGVFDLTSVGLVRMVADFNEGRRSPDGCQTGFTVGVALNPNVTDFTGQINRLKRKIEAGAHFALTQPIFDMPRLEMVQEALARSGIEIPVYFGIVPLLSARNAEFLHNEVPGIWVPEEIRGRISRWESAADQRACGIEIATELVCAFRERVPGFYFICPRNKAELLLPLIDAALSG